MLGLSRRIWKFLRAEQCKESRNVRGGSENRKRNGKEKEKENYVSTVATDVRREGET
jgi:hypothetical protein